MNFTGLPVIILALSRRAAAGVGVELGQDQAVDFELLVERLGGVHRVLAAHGVEDEEYLVRLGGPCHLGAVRPSARRRCCHRPAWCRGWSDVAAGLLRFADCPRDRRRPPRPWRTSPCGATLVSSA
jgi:hypothetical protein